MWLQTHSTPVIVVIGRTTDSVWSRNVLSVAGFFGTVALRFGVLRPLSVAALMAVGGGSALAQTASQVTPQTTLAPSPGGPVTLVFPGTPGLGTPEGAESLTVTLGGVEIAGGKPDLAAAEQEVKTALTGRVVSVAEIFAKARDLEAAYAEAGYILVRVVVPAQSLKDGGTLQLTVVEGFIERVDTANVPDRIRGRVERMITPLTGRPDVTMKEIERRLLLVSDTPGLTLKTALATGAQPGGTVLVVNAEIDAVVPFLGVDNTLPESLGTWVVHTGVDFNSLLRTGETIYLRASTHPEANGPAGIFGSFDDDPRFRSLTAGFITPLGINGLTFNAEGVVTQTTPAPIGGALQMSSMFEKFSARWSYPLVRTRKLTLKSTLTLDIQNETQSIMTVLGDLPLFEDRLRVLRGTVEGTWTPKGTLSGATTLSVGIDALNARTAAEAFPVPLSRQGADATFARLEGKLGYSQTLSPHFAFSLTGRAQTSFGTPLLQSEQFSIANVSELSAFDSGALSGDSGWVVRFEPSFPFTIDREKMDLAIAPYVFGAVGTVYLHQPTILEQPKTSAAVAGIGLRMAGTVGKVQPSLSVEYGWAWRENAPRTRRLTVVGSLRF